jgi:ComF family protein
MRRGIISIFEQIGGLLDLLFPPVCPLCLTLLRGLSPPFCGDCRADILPLPQARCSRCALPFPTQEGSCHLCGDCSRKLPLFAQVTAAGLYAGSLKTALQRFKYAGMIDLDRPLARLLLECLPPALDAEIIVPVPLHVSRLRRRGYNQSLLLAKELAHKLLLPLRPEILERIVDSHTQQGLSARQRALNLNGAFVAKRRLDGRHILLIDDVMTTGTTLTSCTQALLDAGAAQVSVAVVARAAKH